VIHGFRGPAKSVFFFYAFYSVTTVYAGDKRRISYISDIVNSNRTFFVKIWRPVGIEHERLLAREVQDYRFADKVAHRSVRRLAGLSNLIYPIQ
jgi:hypothetical protein